MPTTVGIVGYGSFGAFLEVLIRRFAPKTRVRIHSSRQKPDGKKFFPLEAVAQCDVVVLAVPIAAFEEVLARVVPLVGGHTVIVDVATVKMHTTELLKKYAVGKRYLATHPMFGPESYEKKGGEVAGLRVVISESTLPKGQTTALTAFLKKCGFDVVEMNADRHDKHLAETLFLTHFVGQVVARGKFNRTDIDTVSFGYLMDAVESVKHDTALFRDVYRFNPYCEEILKRFESAEGEVHALLKEDRIQK
ncbi:MAG: prephenate dehydrogenase/arogenate dehydrogenase family protein [Patescibacteria group bacterium]